MIKKDIVTRSLFKTKDGIEKKKYYNIGQIFVNGDRINGYILFAGHKIDFMGFNPKEKNQDANIPNKDIEQNHNVEIIQELEEDIE